MITRNSDGQPFAREENGAVRLVIPATANWGERSLLLSAAKAEEVAIELEHAAKVARGEI